MSLPSKTDPRRGDRDSKHVTLVIIPHHGASLYQWRVPRPIWYALVMGLLALIVSAGWIVGRQAQHQWEWKQLRAEREANRRLALELGKGRTALKRVASFELELRKMLRHGSEKSLLGAGNVGGPSEDDMRRLSEELERDAGQAADEARDGVESLVRAADRREISVRELRRYVEGKRSLLAAKPWGWPVRGWISSGFGTRSSPFSGEKGYHAGVDIANDQGTPARATADGRVSFAGWEGGYGKLVVINHGHGYSTLYGHLNEIKVSTGQSLRRGAAVGLLGSTGDATGPHLHYEVRVYGASVDPQKYLE